MSGVHPLTGTALGYSVDFSVTEVGPCGKGRGAPLCAELALTLTADPAGLLSATGQATRAMLAGNPAVDSLRMIEGAYTEHWVGRVEIGTLLPWSWTTETASSIRFAVGGAETSRVQTRHREQTWAW